MSMRGKYTTAPASIYYFTTEWEASELSWDDFRNKVLGAALSRGEHGALVHSWLSVLSDAVVSERQDVEACDTFAAACSVRLAG